MILTNLKKLFLFLLVGIISLNLVFAETEPTTSCNLDSTVCNANSQFCKGVNCVDDGFGYTCESYFCATCNCQYTSVCDQNGLTPGDSSTPCYQYCYRPTDGISCGDGKICWLSSCMDNTINFHDAFGLNYVAGTPTDHNSPSPAQGTFSKSGTENVDSWTLKKITYPSGSSASWNFEVDTWFTSRGDAIQPLAGLYKNYYAYLRHKDDSDGISKTEMCEANYGGGLRVKSITQSDGLGNSYTTTYDYNMYDSELDCVRTSGAISLVPFSPAESDTSDKDLRRPSHRGGPYVMGGVIYNEVKETVGSGNGYTIYKFLTVDSTPENTNGAIDENALDYYYNDVRLI
ncbi:MAG: hypothetical protein KKC26_01390 [Nanoarchaeota archaeon]|nr:hypothetical protein [Nanoarchaeota archaeon]